MNNPKTNPEQSSSFLTISWFQISNSTYMIFPANQRPCKFFMMLFGLAIYSSIHWELLLSYRPWIIDRCSTEFFFFWRSKTWTESENHTSALCNFFHHHLPRDISGVWTLSPLMTFTYMNPQQPHTQGLLKCAVYGLKYYGWATREKLYHSYPTTDTSLVPSHYKTEPSASRI